MPPTATLPSAADALTALNGYQAPSAADVMTQADNKYGVNDLQTRVSNLQSLTGNLTNAIAAVDPSVTARTAGSLTTEGQRSALVAREQQPLQQNLSSENQSLGEANTNLNTAQGNAKDYAAGVNADNQQKHQNLLDTYNIANAREAAAAQAAADNAKQAEAVREYNQSRQDTLSENAANRAASAANSSAKAAADAGKGYGVKQLSSGNYSFTDSHGTPVSMAQYAEATGANIMDLLRNSKSSYDQQAFKDATYWLSKGGDALAEKNLRIKYGKLF